MSSLEIPCPEVSVKEAQQVIDKLKKINQYEKIYEVVGTIQCLANAISGVKTGDFQPPAGLKKMAAAEQGKQFAQFHLNYWTKTGNKLSEIHKHKKAA